MILYTSRRKRAGAEIRKSPKKGLDKISKIWYNEGVASRENEDEELRNSILKIEQCNQRGTLEDSVFTEETR